MINIFCFVLLFFGFVCLGFPSFAQQVEEADIAAAIAKIDGPDPIQRVLDTRKALKSEDPLLRSLALGKSLQSTDGHVREVGLLYLLQTVKLWVVTLAQEDSNGSDLSTDTKNTLSQHPLLRVRPRSFCFLTESSQHDSD